MTTGLPAGDVPFLLYSLCSKHFFEVGEQRKTEEQGFRYFAHVKNGRRVKIRKRVAERGMKEMFALDFGNLVHQLAGLFIDWTS